MTQIDKPEWQYCERCSTPIAASPEVQERMITDAKSGVIKQPGKGLLDAKLSTAAVDLKDAIVQYTSDRMEAQYLGRKFVTDLDRITDGLTLRSTPDTHNKINKWWVERQRQAQEAS